MHFYYNNTWKFIIEKLSSDIHKGLLEELVPKRRQVYGDNEIKLPLGSSGIFSYIKELISIYLFICLFIDIFLLVNKNYVLALFVTIILFTNIFLRWLNIYQKKKQVEFLQNINYTTVSVLRDGVEKVVKAEELVVGDIVYVRKGSLIAADMRVIRAHNIKVDEKNVTGENFLKDKYESKIGGEVSSISEMKNILFKGTVIKEGEGAGIVISTGNNTQLGKLLTAMNYANSNKNTLKSMLDKNINKLYLLISFVTLVIYLLNKEIISVLLFLLGIIPIELILNTYIYILKKDLNNEGIELINTSTLELVKDLEILFLDKVGSITLNKMVVKGIVSNNKLYDIDKIDYKKDININRLMDILLLCNNSTYNIEADDGSGDLSEIAYIRFASNNRIYKSLLDSKNKRIFEVPMDSDKRMLTTLNKSKKGYRANIKGDVDKVLERCTHIMIDGLEKEITNEDINMIKALDFNYSVEGLKTQGVAYRSFNYQPSISENVESNLVFVGIVALENPIIEDVDKQILSIKQRGIIHILFTDDNKIAATAIGQKTRLISDPSLVISGIELDSLSKEELIGVLSKAKIFSRVNPEIKSKIVGLFNQDGYKVGVAGETLGDLSFLGISKVGISKGKAPEIVKKVSDLFIKDNYLNKFLNLFDVSQSFMKNLYSCEKITLIFLLSQLISLNLISLIDYKVGNNFIPVLITNLVIFSILTVGVLNSGLKSEGIGLSIFKILACSVLTFLAAYIIKDQCEIVFLIVFTGSLLINIIINLKTKLFHINISSILLYFAIFIWILSIGIFGVFNGVSFTLYEMISLVIILVIYLIIELIVKKVASIN
ncbi:MAG: cation-transporting P-type ATPase [Clostridium sp.]|uniref:HAD-IC family P-type ATPase n=1 Tax=Clostridium sp. TaxID=1506 RepID=UPI0025BC2754|nr:HAD-IC family P-type ATPase [Clostridium sp.]MBS5925651.1 cation-transporting P-type ATPase [Clostridium sp.]